MFQYNFNYELKSLLRNKWILSVSLLLLCLCLFSGYNGNQKVAKRIADIEKVSNQVMEGDSLALVLLDSLAAGHQVNVSSWRRPDRPTAVGAYNPRVAAMPPAPLALIATGQSDIFTHYVQPSIYGDEFALKFTELSSPVQLLFGSFDLSFVLIYLLPLIVIAFTYDLLSSERENGSLRLLASQPLSIFAWLSQKALIRFSLLSVILGVAIKLTLAANQVPLVANWNEIGSILAITFAYLLFWFALALLVNLLGKSSANNAISLLAIWIFLVLLIPTVINQTANSIYPVPSRAQLINDMRSIKAETEKEQDKILAEYLRNHPELAVSQDSTRDNWYQSYFASQDLVKQKMDPILAGYDQQIRKQQQWVNNLRFLSPAIVLQDGLNELAQTSTKHYESYRTQVIAFSEGWRSFFLPMIFKDEKITKATFTQLPKFEYNTSDISSNIGINLMSLLILGIGMLAIAFSIFRVRGSEGILTMS